MYRYLPIFLLAVFLYSVTPCCNASQSNDSITESQDPLGLTARQIELIQQVLAVGGELTPEIHAEYWAGFKNLKEADTDLIAADIKKSAPAILLYQKELWQSAKLSLKASKVVRTSELESAWAQVKQVSPDGNDEAQAQASEFLEAAASGKPLMRGDLEFYVTEEVIDTVLSGLDKSIERLIHLLDRKWGP